jgi:hypothetical protein
MIANIGGLSEGLIFLLGWTVTFYNARAFEDAIAYTIFNNRAQKVQQRKSLKIKKAELEAVHKGEMILPVQSWFSMILCQWCLSRKARVIR